MSLSLPRPGPLPQLPPPSDPPTERDVLIARKYELMVARSIITSPPTATEADLTRYAANTIALFNAYSKEKEARKAREEEALAQVPVPEWVGDEREGNPPVQEAQGLLLNYTFEARMLDREVAARKLYNGHWGDGFEVPYVIVPFWDGKLPPGPEHRLPTLLNARCIDSLTSQQFEQYLQGYGVDPVPEGRDDRRRALREAIGWNSSESYHLARSSAIPLPPPCGGVAQPPPPLDPPSLQDAQNARMYELSVVTSVVRGLGGAPGFATVEDLTRVTKYTIAVSNAYSKAWNARRELARSQEPDPEGFSDDPNPLYAEQVDAPRLLNYNIDERLKDNEFVMRQTWNRSCGDGHEKPFILVPFLDGTLPTEPQNGLPVYPGLLQGGLRPLLNEDCVSGLTPHEVERYLRGYGIDLEGLQQKGVDRGRGGEKYRQTLLKVTIGWAPPGDVDVVYA